jgi:hypothetical protein
MQILRSGDMVDVPWKNGGGITREIAKGLRGTQTLWRISRADVAADGAFSDFAGLTRILTVVQGGTMLLDHAGGTLVARLWEPLRFDGGLKVHARLTDGPLTDLNLMFDPTLCHADVILREGPATQTITAGQLALHILSGTPRINGTAIGVADSAFAGRADLVLAQGDALLEVRIDTPAQSDDITLASAAR